MNITIDGKDKPVTLDEALRLIKPEVHYEQHHGGCPPAVKFVELTGKSETISAINTLKLEEALALLPEPFSRVQISHMSDYKHYGADMYNQAIDDMTKALTEEWSKQNE